MDFFIGLAALLFLSLFFLNYFFNFNNNFYFNNCILLFLFIYFSFFFSFFLLFILSHVDDRVFMLQPGIRPMPLRWESRVQDISPPENSQLHVISNGETVIQSEVSQKEKNKYCMLTHIYGI